MSEATRLQQLQTQLEAARIGREAAQEARHLNSRYPLPPELT
jgi:hypothetical protein